MNKQMNIEEKTNAVIAYLRPLIEDELLLYAYQIKEGINLKDIRNKVYEELALIDKAIASGDGNDFSQTIRKASKNIAFHIDMCLDVAFLASAKEKSSIFLPSFLSYSNNIARKLHEIYQNVNN